MGHHTFFHWMKFRRLGIATVGFGPKLGKKTQKNSEKQIFKKMFK